MEEADLLKERLQAITEKRRVREDILRKKQELDMEKVKLQHLKKKSLREQWLLEDAASHNAMQQQHAQGADQQRTRALQSNIHRIEMEVESLEREESMISTNESFILKRLKAVEKSPEEIIKEAQENFIPGPVKTTRPAPEAPQPPSPPADAHTEPISPEQSLFAVEINVAKNLLTGESRVVSTASVAPQELDRHSGVKVYDDGRKCVYALEARQGSRDQSCVSELSPREVERLLRDAALHRNGSQHQKETSRAERRSYGNLQNGGLHHHGNQDEGHHRGADRQRKNKAEDDHRYSNHQDEGQPNVGYHHANQDEGHHRGIHHQRNNKAEEDHRYSNHQDGGQPYFEYHRGNQDEGHHRGIHHQRNNKAEEDHGYSNHQDGGQPNVGYHHGNQDEGHHRGIHHQRNKKAEENHRYSNHQDGGQPNVGYHHRNEDEGHHRGIHHSRHNEGEQDNLYGNRQRKNLSGQQAESHHHGYQENCSSQRERNGYGNQQAVHRPGTRRGPGHHYTSGDDRHFGFQERNIQGNHDEGRHYGHRLSNGLIRSSSRGNEAAKANGCLPPPRSHGQEAMSTYHPELCYTPANHIPLSDYISVEGEELYRYDPPSYRPRSRLETSRNGDALHSAPLFYGPPQSGRAPSPLYEADAPYTILGAMETTEPITAVFMGFQTAQDESGCGQEYEGSIKAELVVIDDDDDDDDAADDGGGRMTEGKSGARVDGRGYPEGLSANGSVRRKDAGNTKATGPGIRKVQKKHKACCTVS